MAAIRRILSVSHDRATMLARNDALAVSGFSVVSPRQPADALYILATSDIDIILLGHSIPAEERAEMMQQFRGMKKQVPIIVLYDIPPDDAEKADAFVALSDGPERLIEAIEKCLSGGGRRAIGA